MAPSNHRFINGCQLTNLGVTILVVGALGVTVSLIGLTALRFNLPTFHGRRVPRATLITVFSLTFAAIAVFGLAITGPRHVPDTVAAILLSLVPTTVVVALLLDVRLRWKETVTWLRSAVEVGFALLIAGGVI